MIIIIYNNNNVMQYNNKKAIEFISEVGRRITEVTKEQQETMFLFQRIFVALQRGNAIAFRNTFPSEH